MRLNKSMTLLTSFILLFTSLACNASRFEGLADPEAAEARVAAASTRAVEAAATAAIFAEQAQEIAATIAVEGSQAVATLQASDITLPSPADLRALQERVATVLPDENGNVTVMVMEAELNQLLQEAEAEALARGEQPRIRNTAVRFTDELIIVSGNIQEPIVGLLSVSFRPVVTGNSVNFRIEAANVGDIPVPPALLGAAEATLNNTLGEALTQLSTTIALQSINVGEGSLLIVGQRSQ